MYCNFTLEFWRYYFILGVINWHSLDCNFQEFLSYVILLQNFRGIGPQKYLINIWFETKFYNKKAVIIKINLKIVKTILFESLNKFFSKFKSVKIWWKWKKQSQTDYFAKSVIFLLECFFSVNKNFYIFFAISYLQLSKYEKNILK